MKIYVVWKITYKRWKKIAFEVVGVYSTLAKAQSVAVNSYFKISEFWLDDIEPVSSDSSSSELSQSSSSVSSDVSKSSSLSKSSSVSKLSESSVLSESSKSSTSSESLEELSLISISSESSSESKGSVPVDLLEVLFSPNGVEILFSDEFVNK